MYALNLTIWGIEENYTPMHLSNGWHKTEKYNHCTLWPNLQIFIEPCIESPPHFNLWNVSFVMYLGLTQNCTQWMYTNHNGKRNLTNTVISNHFTLFLQTPSFRQGFDCDYLFNWLIGNKFRYFFGSRLKWAVWPHQIFTNCTLPSFISKACSGIISFSMYLLTN